MSDEPLGHLDLRHLPPVEPVEVPERFSQTMMRHGDSCKRAAYLYQRHHGGTPAHELDRGTAFHLTWQKINELILEQFALDEGSGDVDFAVDESTAKLLLEEVLDEHPELTVPLWERDQLRVMASHVANGWKVNPAHIVGVEQKFLLQLGEHTVSGILDLALIDGVVGIVRDAKTEWAMPSQAEYDATWQGRFYAVLLVYGSPVSEVACSDCNPDMEIPVVLPRKDEAACATCGGRCWIEHVGPPLGSHLQVVDVGEVFPRFLQDDGTVPVRNKLLARIEIDALRHDLEQQARGLGEAFKTWEFPAVDGSHCQRCPCEPECPLPKKLRRFKGSIQTFEQAREAAEWWHRNAGIVDATRTEIRNFCKQNGPLRFGADMVFEFSTDVRNETDWPGLEAAVVRSANYGEPFQLTRYRRQALSSRFKERKLTETELAAERDVA